MVYGMELTYNEIVVKLEIKHIGAKTTGYTLSPGRFEIWWPYSDIKVFNSQWTESNECNWR